MNPKTVKKPKIEAIYPLSQMQQGLLFHHLMKGEDQGFLNVQCEITGQLDRELLKQSWEVAVQRHEVMRTSVHWKKVERPVLLVRPKKEIEWSFIDWTHKTTVEQEESLNLFKKEQKDKGVNFEKNPLSKISIIQKTNEQFYFIWNCHHLLLDGWSSTIILKDAFSIYDSLFNHKPVQLPTIPSYKTYNNWLKKIPGDTAKEFWKNTFSNFNEPSLFLQNSAIVENTNPSVYEYDFNIDTSKAIKNLAKKYKVTLNTLFQGIWSLILVKSFSKSDVTFGNTVSGRSIPFPNIENMAGMFANVLPVRTRFDLSEPFQSSLKWLQSQQQTARNYEYCRLDQIVSWASLPENNRLFDSLFVFENFPWNEIKSGKITVGDFKSGITTTYPLTIIFVIEDCIKYKLLVDTNIIPTSASNWFLNSISTIANHLLKNSEDTIDQILSQISVVPEVLFQKKNTNEVLGNKEENYTAPKNQLELTLVEIWEQLFGINYISVTDSFFQLGGKSLLSVKMFSIIEERLGVKLPPTTLLESPTIQSLAEVINTKNAIETNAWNYLVPIKTKGKKAPLFCVHAGGGHVFFYKALADAIDIERPVYAIQPLGIFGEKNKHQSIEKMAKDYANEISKIQTEGVLNIVVYCFSTAVGLEMVSYLKTKGRDAHLIVADTIAEHRLLLDKERLLIRMKAFFKRFFSNPFKALNTMIGYRIFFYLKPLKIKLFGNEAEKNTEKMRLHLVKLFNAYQWHTKINQISLVLTEKGDASYNKEIIRSWKPLVNNSINVENCEGNHATFFENPDVIHTAKAIDSIITEN